MKNLKGFSLIELMITFTIVGIMMSYAMPSFYQLKLNKLMENERNRLTTSLNFARNYAVKNQQHVIICPSTSGHSCDNESKWFAGWIVFLDSNKNRELDAGDLLLQNENAMQKEIIATSSIYRQKIRYNGMGFSPGTNLSINFCDARGSEFAQSIVLNNAGRIKQSKPISDNVCN